MFGPPSAAVGLLCLIAAALIATVGRMHWPRLTVALTLTGAVGILNGTIGPALHRQVTKTDNELGHMIGRFTGTTVLGVIGIVVLAVAGFRVYQKKIDNRTLALVGAVPLTVTVIPGWLGVVLVTLVGIVPALLGAGISWAFGL